jgi:hypothetical protein
MSDNGLNTVSNTAESEKACESILAYKLVEIISTTKYNSSFYVVLENRPEDYLESYDQFFNLFIEKLPGLTVKQIAGDCINIFLQARKRFKSDLEAFRNMGLSTQPRLRKGVDGIFHQDEARLRRC